MLDSIIEALNPTKNIKLANGFINSGESTTHGTILVVSFHIPEVKMCFAHDQPVLTCNWGLD